MSSAFKRKSFYLAFLISIAAFATLVQAQDKGLKKIIWGQTSISSSQWIPWIAKDAKIYEKDPFASLDPYGVGRLMKIAIQEGRAARPGLKVGICGEHGGDPASIQFFERVGLDYVSCSPFRVPVARLAAAQAALAART